MAFDHLEPAPLPPPPPPPRRRQRLVWPYLALAALLALFAVPALLRLAAEWPWFAALGFERVFATQLLGQGLLGLAVGLFTLLFLGLNFRLALRGAAPEPPRAHPEGGLSVDPAWIAARLALPTTLGLTALFGLVASGAWLEVLQFWHRVPFGDVDPVFGRDVSFYVYVVPVAASGLGALLVLTVVALVGAVTLYSARRDVLVLAGGVHLEPGARAHVALLVALAFLVLGARTFLVSIPGLLYSSSGPVFGASYADLHGTLPGLRLAGGAAFLGAGLSAWAAWGRRLGRAAAWGAGLYVAALVLGAGIYPSLVQRLVVAPNELSKETPQLLSHIAATRKAWGLDGVVTRDLTGEAQLSAGDIANNPETIENVRLWDRDPLLQTFGQLQEIRTYYDFVSVDDDRYRIDGRYRQVLLSARELNSSALPTRTFINEHLTFTHGMGLTLSPANQVTTEGLPVLLVKDLPPSAIGDLKVTRPEIYFGELTDSWVFVNTGQKEFDYPSGDQNIFASYAGTAGVKVDSLWRRLVLAAYFQSLKVLLSSDITEKSSALWFRNIQARAQKALPFLLFDTDPYLVVTDAGRLKWILDAYTRTSRYPYAQRLPGGVNYLRNSVKVVIDAYDGTVDAYLVDLEDPLVRTLDAAFPGIFRPLASMPEDLRRHLRYPEDLFRVQSDLYATYHMAEPEIFYHREDQWQKPLLTRAGNETDPFLRHMIMRLPGEKNAEFIFMVPFTPRGKDNLASWMVARNDGDAYGQLVVYRFPKQSLVFGPTQMQNRINQDPEISRQLSLWDQRGSEVLRGSLLVIPINEALIYVQPIYLRAEGGRIPELKRVVLAYQNRVLMNETLEGALAEMFGEGAAAPPSVVAAPTPPGAPAGAAPPAPPAGPEQGPGALTRRASELYRQAIEAQRAGDWAGYGQRLEQLGQTLKQLEELSAPAPLPAPAQAPATPPAPTE